MIVLAIALTLAQAAPQEEQPPPADDFDLLPKEAAPDPAAVARQKELERSLKLRRNMLHFHQIGGFLTLGGLSLTVLFGQLDYLDKYGGNGDTGKWHPFHSV